MSVLEVKFRNDEVFLPKHHEMTLDNYIKKISTFNYDKFYEKYRNSKDETSAEKAQFPAINYVFYTYIFLNTSVPSPQKLIEEYFKIYKGMFGIHQEQNLVTYKGTEYSYSTVIGIILRTYPSLVRDFHFFLMLKESGLFEQVIYSCKDDIKGKDITIKHNGKTFELSLFVDTKRSLFYKAIKNIKRHVYDEKEIQVPVDFKKADKCGDFYVYGENDIRKLKMQFYDNRSEIK